MHHQMIVLMYRRILNVPLMMVGTSFVLGDYCLVTRSITVVPAPSPAPAAPKSRYERLESRISMCCVFPGCVQRNMSNQFPDELETLLRDKADTTSASPSTGSDVPSPQPSIVLSGDFGTLPDTTHSPLSHSFDGEVWSKAYFPHTARDNNTNTAGLSAFSDPLDQLAGVASLMRPTSLTDQRSNSSSMSSHDHSSGSPTVHGDIEFIPIASVTPSNVDEVTSMLYMSWPANLPDVSITRHLCVYDVTNPCFILLTTASEYRRFLRILSMRIECFIPLLFWRPWTCTQRILGSHAPRCCMPCAP